MEENNKQSKPPLTAKDVSIAKYLDNPPSPRQWVFKDILNVGIVAQICGPGGSSKSMLMIQWAVCLATMTPLGIFNPVKKHRVLLWCCEDPEDILHERIYYIAKEFGLIDSEDLRENLQLYSGLGRAKPIVGMDDNSRNPNKTEEYEWLEQCIKNIKPEVVLFDPKSRLCALDEINNVYNTYWIQVLEKLAFNHRLTIIFSHHVSQAARQTGNINSLKGRGGTGLDDGCRLVIAIQEMKKDSKKQKEYNISNPYDYVEVRLNKPNYVPKLPESVWFKRNEYGILLPIELSKDQSNSKDRRDSLDNPLFLPARHLVKLVNEERCKGKYVSAADLKYGKSKTGKYIVKQLKSLKSEFKVSEIIAYAMEQNMFTEELEPKQRGSRGPAKLFLKPKGVRLWSENWLKLVENNE